MSSCLSSRGIEISEVSKARLKAKASNIFVQLSQISTSKVQNFHIPVSEVFFYSFHFLHLSMAKNSTKSKIDQYLISQVRRFREEKGFTQEDIAIHLDLSTGFIGHIESPNYRAKYNAQHLNELAKLFKCSPKDFWPEKPLQ